MKRLAFAVMLAILAQPVWAGFWREYGTHGKYACYKSAGSDYLAADSCQASQQACTDCKASGNTAPPTTPLPIKKEELPKPRAPAPHNVDEARPAEREG